ncbi:hypothetical protein CMESO_308 (nucleomorph) [Chroomonas mesostigmatica CCMP1168]|uniref:Uncharacterized protein n=1 Tax=Chroomonas mesostigmatica CCMP1168 TaxID=1195612 RepID=J7G5Y1_9CRYP|nr:hypothetical protein CMESO_308 [Chroomonas mesostigmatica CCMP1168]|mmetsp:Transcript_17254/g.42131  ORF Transcript_17254/g.42131 Transcript_17254/m.42131 type:complete len:148 (+) Transcript_17254:227-670(+)
MRFFFHQKKVNFQKKNDKFFPKYTKIKVFLLKLGNQQTLKIFSKKKAKSFFKNRKIRFKKKATDFLVQILPEGIFDLYKILYLNKKLFRLKYWRSFFFFYNSLCFFLIDFFKYKTVKLHYFSEYLVAFFPISIEKKYKYLLSSHQIS